MSGFPRMAQEKRERIVPGWMEMNVAAQDKRPEKRGRERERERERETDTERRTDKDRQIKR